MEAFIALASLVFGIYLTIVDRPQKPEVKFTGIRIRSDGRICRYSRFKDQESTGPLFVELDS